MLWPPPEPRHATSADRAACTVLLRRGSRTFFAASRLLPARLREPAPVLYAFCRLADDAADLASDDAPLSAIRRRLAQIYDGAPQPLPVDRALADLVQDFALPRGLLEALFEGFAWDAAGRRYRTLDELLDYAARVAGTVGAMMAVLMGRRAPATVARACELGMAMQLTNIARDVGEDARNGRLYLPRQWMREAGLDPDAWLAAPQFNEALGSVVARLLATADALYARADHGIAALPRTCRPGIRAARLLYAEIGAELARRSLDSVSQRTVVPTGRKLRLLARAFLSQGGAPKVAQPVPAARFLVETVAATPGPRDDPLGPPWWSFDQQVGRMIELLERAERRRLLVGRNA